MLLLGWITELLGSDLRETLFPQALQPAKF